MQHARQSYTEKTRLWAKVRMEGEVPKSAKQLLHHLWEHPDLVRIQDVITSATAVSFDIAGYRHPSGYTSIRALTLPAWVTVARNVIKQVEASQ